MIDPSRYFEIKGQVEPLRAHVANIPVALNTTALAAIAGKRIRVMGLMAQGSAAVTTLTLKNGNAGTSLFGPFNIPSSATPNVLFLPVIDAGYFETSTGVGLFADCAGASTIVNLYYVEYAP